MGLGMKDCTSFIKKIENGGFMKNITKYVATALITGIILTSGSAHATSLKPVSQARNPDGCLALQAQLDKMLEAFGELEERFGTDVVHPNFGPGRHYTPDVASMLNDLWVVISSFYYSAYNAAGCKLTLHGGYPEYWDGPSPARPYWPN